MELRDLDRDWRSQLHGLSLVAEATINTEYAIAALRHIAERANGFDPKQRKRFLQRYSPSVLAGMTAIAAAKYDEGTFWPHVAEVTGWGAAQPQQILLSETFRYGLDLLGLERFDTPLRNIGEILLHAGIPTASLADLVRLLQQRNSRERDLSGADFVTWVSGMDRATAAAKGLNAPTWRFLVETGDIATDLVERLLTVMDAATHSTDDLPIEALPAHLGRELQRLYSTGEVSRKAGKRTGSRGRLIPRVLYHGGTFQVELPAYEERLAEDITWRITIAGETRLREVAAPWPGDLPSVTRDILRKPDTSVVVGVRGHDLEWTLPLVDKASPLVAFDAANGALVPPRATLPRGRVWLAFPNEDDKPLAEILDVDGDLKVIEQPDPPYGWDGWSIVLADLAAATKVRHKGKDSSPLWRFVSTVSRPQLEDVPTLPFVRTPSGVTVLSTRPQVIIPPVRTRDGSEESATPDPSTAWTVTVTSATDDTLHRVQVSGRAEPTSIDPWPPTQDDIRGEFTIQVQGPLGRGATFEVTVVEGIRVTSTTDFRWLARGGGLEPCTVTLHDDPESREVVLESDDRTARLSLPTDQGVLTLVTDVDYAWIAVADGSAERDQGIGPARLETESLPDLELRINLPPGSRGVVEMVARSQVLQSAPAVASSTGIVRFNLATIADTATQHGAAELYLRTDERLVDLASIRPRQLVSDIDVVDDDIVVTKNGDSVPIELGLYLSLAPWLPPASVALPPGTSSIPLPEPVRGRGRVIVAARAHDPWSSQAWPTGLPERSENTHVIEQPIEKFETVDDQLIAWAGGAGELPASVESLTRVLNVYATLDQTRTERWRSTLFDDVAALTHDLGDVFIDAALDSEWLPTSHTRLLTHGWPATARAQGLPVRPTTWKTSPYLGVLESLGGWHIGDALLRAQVEATLGENAVRLLEDGTDPSASIGAFRGTAEALDRMPAAQLDVVWSAINPLPGAFLDQDQRMIHARELFDARVDVRVRALASKSSSVLRTVHTVLQSELGEKVREPVRERAAGEGWPSLPCLTISLALLARLAARGSEPALATFNRYRSRFADLTAAAPSFVEQDLVLAELWLTRWETP